MSRIAERAAAHLAAADKPMSMADLCAAVGIKRKSSSGLHYQLVKLLGDKLLTVTPRLNWHGAALYSIAPGPEAVEPPAPKGFMPKDLWRGWINPATGIKPPRLGVDFAPRTSTTQA